MAEYKGLNIVFRGDATDASKALSILSNEAKAAQGNLTAVQSALKNTATNGKDLNQALAQLQLSELGKAWQAAADKAQAYRDTIPQLTQRQQELRAEIESTKAAMSGMGEAKLFPDGTAMSASELAAHLNSVEEQERSVTLAIDDANRNMLVQESQARSLAAEHTKLAASMTDFGRFGAAAQEFGDAMQGVGDKLSSVGDKLTLVSTAVAMTFGREVISQTEDFGNAIAQLGGYLDMSGSQLDSMSDLALKFGKDTQFSATEAAQAMNELAKGGMTQAQISGGAMEATMQLAAAGELDMASAANTAVQAIKVFGLENENATAVADALAGAANKSTAEVSDLAQGFSQIGSAAGMAGWDLNEVVGALALLADRGFTGAEAGTTLKTTLQRLASPTDKARQTMDALGISVYDSQGKMVDAAEVIGQFQRALEGLTDEQRNEALLDIFGMRGINGITALLAEGTEGFNEYVAATERAGYANEMAKSRMGELGWALEHLRGEAETAAVNFGTALAPTIEAVARSIEDALNWFNSLSDAEQTQIANLALAVVAAGPVISVVGHVTSGIGGMVSALGTGAANIATFAQSLSETHSVVTAATTAFEGAGAVMSALPVVAVAAAIAMLVGDIKSMVDEVSLVTEATRGAAEMADAASESVRGLSDALDEAGSHADSLSGLIAEANESLGESADFNRDVSDSLTEMEEGVASVEKYAETIKELSDAGNLSAADQERLKQAVEGFNSIAGTSISIIDSQSGKLNILSGKIDAVAEAYRRQAATSTYVALQQKAVEELTRRQEDLKGITEDATGSIFNFGTALQIFDSTHNPLVFAQTASELFNLVTAVNGASDSVDQAADDVEYYNQKVNEAALSTDQYNQFLASLDLLAGKAGGSLKEAADNLMGGGTPTYSPGSVDTSAVEAQKAANDAMIKEQQRANDAAYREQQRFYDAEYKAAQKAYDAEYKELQKALDREYKARKKELDAAYDAEKKATDKRMDELKKSLDKAYQLQRDANQKTIKEAKDANSEAEKELKKSLDNQYNERKKSLDKELKEYQKQNDRILKEAKARNTAETKEFNKATKERIAAIKAEYEARKQSVADNDGTAQIDSRIKELEDQTKAERAAIKRQEQEEKKAELEKAVERAKTRRSRADAEKALNDYLAEIAQENREAEREAEIERLEEQKDLIKDQTKARQEALDEERDARIAAFEEQREQELEQLKLTQDATYEALKESLDAQEEMRKEANAASLESYREELDERLEVMKTQHETELEALTEKLAAELEATKTANDERIEWQKEQDEARLGSIRESNELELEAMKEGHQSQLDALKESQTEQLEALKTAQSDALQAMKDSQSDAIDALRTTLKDANTSMSEGGEAVAQTAKDKGDRTKLGFDGAIQPMPKNTETVMNAVKGHALGALQDLPEGLRQNAQQSNSNFASELGNTGPTTSSANRLKGAAESPFGALPGLLRTFGFNSTSNFDSGIAEGGSNVRITAQNVAGGIEGELKEPSNHSHRWGWDLALNLNEGIVGFWNSYLLPNLQNMAQTIADLLGHSTPKEGPLKGDDQWFYHLAQNLDNGLRRGAPMVFRTARDVASGVSDAIDPDVDVEDMSAQFEQVMQAMSELSAKAAGDVTESFTAAFDDIRADMQATMAELGDMMRVESDVLRDTLLSVTMDVQVNSRALAAELRDGVTEALRSGTPQQSGVTIVVENMQVRNDSDIQRISEGLNDLAMQAARRGF